ncbi:MAG: PAS domain-containing protein [Notoacmeibacter sp.]|nr:PAS domain-containing protein [Notoacmeibacter sp.]MCC0031754.1 PAS domain-containing protein [Brucellaceae bacterium]
MKNQKTIDLFLYWNRLRGNRPAPRRTEVEPADIKTLLADTFILEDDQRGQPVFRLAGTRLCAIFGRELKGFVFSSLWQDRDRRMVARLARNAFADNCVIVMEFSANSRNGRSMEFEACLLPLRGGDESARALGCIAPADRPFWLGVDPIETCRLVSLRVIDPDREPMFLKNRPSFHVPPMEPEGRDLDLAIGAPAGRRVRHLMVLEGGRRDS